ncbi:MAG: diguanylate cyclase [Thermoanaerobaculia bacterium]|nr:MAG: diguanylate cyclase [Thermoanaerobaculia bacterium]
MPEFPGSAWLESLPDAVMFVDGAGIIVHANRRCVDLLGWAPEELVGRGVECLVPARFAAHRLEREHYLAAPSARAMGAGLELVALARDGEEIAVDIALNPVVFEGAGLVLVTIRDVRAERARLEELRVKSIALDEAASGIVITDSDGVIEWTNRAVSRMTGYLAEELVGRRPSLLKSGAHEDDFYRHLWEEIRAGRTWQGAIINRRKDGTFYHEEQTIAPVRDAQGVIRHFIAVKQDGTARVQAELALREAHAELAQRLVEIEQLHGRLREQAIRDELTGLFNRRYFDETLVRELAHAEREGTTLALAMIDLDHFKQVNDRQGHAVGDRLLAELGRLLLTQTRSEDVACRYGGEEFAVVLLGADLEAGVQRAESWRSRFEAVRELPDRDAGPATLSAGVAGARRGERAEQLLARADAALYRAKAEGRNRVVAAR